ncbi:unnamed protein product [Polarella glacialis]|uniref:Uncharacterized protein n=1 Tax=Polarella glacialis TaxID=89957 RepID=A0A813M118_POLGL|nr:unnamed protein product [Polarella glacialis]
MKTRGLVSSVLLGLALVAGSVEQEAPQKRDAEHAERAGGFDSALPAWAHHRDSQEETELKRVAKEMGLPQHAVKDGGKMCCPKHWESSWGLGPACRHCSDEELDKASAAQDESKGLPPPRLSRGSLDRLEQKVDRLALLIDERRGAPPVTGIFNSIPAAVGAASLAGLAAAAVLVALRIRPDVSEIDEPLMKT